MLYHDGDYDPLPSWPEMFLMAFVEIGERIREVAGRIAAVLVEFSIRAANFGVMQPIIWLYFKAWGNRRWHKYPMLSYQRSNPVERLLARWDRFYWSRQFGTCDGCDGSFRSKNLAPCSGDWWLCGGCLNEYMDGARRQAGK